MASPQPTEVLVTESPRPIPVARSTPRRCRIRGWSVSTETETVYLDEDGDGMLDAVVVVERVVATAAGRRRVLGSRRIGYHGVNDAGTAARVSSLGR